MLVSRNSRLNFRKFQNSICLKLSRHTTLLSAGCRARYIEFQGSGWDFQFKIQTLSIMACTWPFLFFPPLHPKTRDKRHGQHGQHKLVVWLHRKFTSMLFFLFKLQLVSVAVSTSHDDKLFHSHDTGVMSHWHHDDRIITDNHLLFLGKVSFSCSQWCLQTICVLLPHPYPLALAVNKSPADLFFITCAWRTLKRNRGSVNRLYW